MQRYLLFDSGCSVCTSLASKIEEESNGWLTARSLRDTDMQNLLNNTQSKWNWEPTLIEVSDTRVRIFTGFKMRRRIALGLGIRRSWKITRLIQQASIALVDEKPFTSQRRRLLQQSKVFAGMVFLPGLGITALKGPTPNDSSSLRVMTPTETANMVPLMTSSAPYRHFLAQLGTTVTPNQPFAVEHGSTLFVTLPLAVNGESENAFFTAALQRKTEQTANILETVAVHREVVPQGKHMRIWVKTALISDTLLDNNGTILDGWMLKEGQRINIAGQNFSTQGREQSDAILQTLMANSDGSPSIASTCYDDCSSACSVPNDIASAAALICGAICIGSLGAGCIACAAGAAGVYAFNVGCCLVKCNGAPILPCCGT